jgi:hypothetical protein
MTSRVTRGADGVRGGDRHGPFASGAVGGDRTRPGAVTTDGWCRVSAFGATRGTATGRRRDRGYDVSRLPRTVALPITNAVLSSPIRRGRNMLEKNAVPTARSCRMRKTSTYTTARP